MRWPSVRVFNNQNESASFLKEQTRQRAIVLPQVSNVSRVTPRVRSVAEPMPIGSPMEAPKSGGHRRTHRKMLGDS